MTQNSHTANGAACTRYSQVFTAQNLSPDIFWAAKSAKNGEGSAIPALDTEFLLHDAVLTRYMLSSCVRLSVTRRYCIKTAKCNIT